MPLIGNCNARVYVSLEVQRAVLDDEHMARTVLTEHVNLSVRQNTSACCIGIQRSATFFADQLSSIAFVQFHQLTESRRIFRLCSALF